jgi:hypothetical protein
MLTAGPATFIPQFVSQQQYGGFAPPQQFNSYNPY